MFPFKRVYSNDTISDYIIQSTQTKRVIKYFIYHLNYINGMQGFDLSQTNKWIKKHIAKSNVKK